MAAEIVLGTMNFGQRTGETEALRILERALEAGITRLDTANLYTDGRSERIVGRFLAESGAHCTVATKVGLARKAGRPEGLSRDAVLGAFAASAERLGRERVDLYYLHAPDTSVPIAETLEALGTLYQRGAIAAWGVSNFSSWQALEALQLAPQFGLPAPAVTQVIHNLLVRQIEIEHLAFARRYGLSVVTYNPLAGGVLSGTRRYEPTPPAGSRFDGNTVYHGRYWNELTFRRVAAYEDLARKVNRTLLDLAYGFAFGAPGVDAVLVGPASVAHLEAALAAHAHAIDGSMRKRIDALHVELYGTDVKYAR